MSEINYSFELHEYNEALSPYGVIETEPPSVTNFVVDDFTDGNHFRTGPDENNSLQLELEDRLLTVIVDESGSMTWNDKSGDRYVFLKRLLSKLDQTYPGNITANLLGFGGVPVKTTMFLVPSTVDLLSSDNQNYDQLLQQTFQDSVYDFSGVRVVRRTDRYPNHPADGVIVAEGIFEAVKDENLVEGQTYYYGVWSFNKDLHFSLGQFVKSLPTDRILPRGVNLSQSFVRILPGVERDSFTQVIYNFSEGSGYIVFDSSSNGFHGIVGTEVIEDNFWSGDSSVSTTTTGGSIKKPVGVRFDGEFDIITTDIETPSLLSPGSTQPISINFWIFRYSNSSQEWVLGTSYSNISDSIGWAIGIMEDGTVGFQSNDLSTGFVSISNTAIPVRTWSMITVGMSVNGSNEIVIEDVRINNVNVSNSPPNFQVGSLADKIYIGAKPESSGTNYTGSDFFGSINLLSIHNTLRGSDYWTNLYGKESLVFNQPAAQSSQNPPDSRQREVLLTWDISSDFDFSGGEVKVVRKYNSIPSNIDDGDLVLTQNAESGQFFFIDSFDFINSGNYYYRIFTINSLGNICDRNDARILSVNIPKSVNEPAVPILSPISNESIQSGNRKLFLQWTNPSDSRWRGTKIYFGTEGFPTITVNNQGIVNVTDGFLILDTLKSSFVHRIFTKEESGAEVSLENGVTYFYTIVSYDKFNRLSEPIYLSESPTSDFTTVFQPEDVKDLHIDIVNPETLSLQWINPTIKSEQLSLFFGDAAGIFVNIRDIFGGQLSDVSNIEFQFCTTIFQRSIKTTERELGTRGDQPPSLPGGSGGTGRLGGFGSFFSEDCNSEQEIAETVLTYTTVGSGLIKGLITHINDRQILSRRRKYVMDIRAQYKVEDQTLERLFEYNTNSVSVSFSHPINISVVNKLNKKLRVRSTRDGKIRGETAPCECPVADNDNGDYFTFNGGYAGATQPYIARVEIQYKGQSLPNGTPINVRLFKHGTQENPNPLNEKSNKTFVREGAYITTAISTDELDGDGNPTGRTIFKSIADIEIQHPKLSDYVDIYVTLDYLGFFIDAVHEIRFIETLFISVDVTKPSSDGIDFAEQFATVWRVNPDDPENPSANLPVPDGTLVKWDLLKLQYGKERPFYSTEILSQNLSGIYSTTINGVARNVFFGPVGNIEDHHTTVKCGDNQIGEECCIGEQYAIKASVILGTETTIDAVKFYYPCSVAQQFTNRRFLMNADPDQPLSGGPSQEPHWITWGDGVHMLKFQIAKNPSISTIYGAECFRRCVESEVGGQLFAFPDQHIVQIKADGEILWNVVFDEDPYTGNIVPVSYDSISPSIAENLGIPFIANIPITGETTDFYVRYNTFIGDRNPTPQDCESAGGLNNSSVLPCEWVGVCQDQLSCSPTSGIKWDYVSVIKGTTTLISDNSEITLLGGGTYADGIPPIYLGFREPLYVNIVDARVNGQRVDELIVDGISQHTFTVEVTFSGESVPDGTPLEISVSGPDQNIVILSSCINAPDGCQPGSGGVIYTRNVNDPIINPQNSSNTVAARSLAYFSINPLPDIAFNAKINVTCRYDKIGTVDREISRCIEVNNTVNVQTPDTVPLEDNVDIENAATSNELIVYDTVKDLYTVTKGNKQRRMGHFYAGINIATADYMFIFGGLTGNGDSSTQNLTPRSEKFDLQIQEWEFTTDMPTPRAYGQQVVKDDKIYLIGGIELDQLLNQYIVSRKIEMFDVATEMWNTTLSPMPENNGVAFGNAFIFGEYIYVTCGVTSVDNSSQPGDLNSVILRYSINDDEWVSITPSNLLEYQRLSPFGFYRSSPRLSSGLIDDNQKYIYIYGGSVPKNLNQVESERTELINRQIQQLYSFLYSSAYYLNLPKNDQDAFRTEKEEEIRNSTIIPAFVYPKSGFKFYPGSESLVNDELTIDTSQTIDSEWRVLPLARDHGVSVYIPHQDIVYFIGGSNQNKSTTLNINESIDLFNNNQYSRMVPLNRGRAMFGAIAFADEIYLTGGLTSGHSPGYVEIDIQPRQQFIEAMGVESGGFFITLKNDSGEVINSDIRVDVRGRLRMPIIDDVLSEFLARRAADRALGGDGSGTALDLPQDENDEIDLDRLIKSQNKIIDPNSDGFQFNAAKKLNDEVELFPVIYSSNEFTIDNGIGGVNLLPRSEDPLADFEKLSQFIKLVLQNTSSLDEDERFVGDLTRDELAALGDVLLTVKLPPTIINSGRLRNLYTIETKVTILDPVFFGQTVSDFDLNIQEKIENRIQELLTPPEDEPQSGNFGGFNDFFGGSVVTNSDCFLIQHSAQPDVAGQSQGTSINNTNAPRGVGGFSGSGQCLFCQTIIPTNVDIRSQLSTVSSGFYNIVDWIPQIKRRLTESNHSLESLIEELDIIDHEVPFGSSQLYDAMVESARITSSDDLNFVKKSIYIVSDNSQNLSLSTRTLAISEVNAIDGDKNVPVIYTVFSTSFPISLSAQLERSQIGDVEKITSSTGGQATTLIQSGFINQILNIAIGSATGGLGYGVYTRKIEFGELSAITGMTLNFLLPANTRGLVRFRSSQDGFNFTDFSERYEGNQFIDFVDFFAKTVEIEVVLTTGFAVDVSEEYDSTPTGIPKLINIIWEISGEKEDFIFLNKEQVNTNTQQVAMAFEGTVPTNAIVEMGVATSESSHWDDFQTLARPSVREFGKTFILDRTNESAIVETEKLTTVDGKLYKSNYGPWDPESTVTILEIDSTGNEIPVLSGFVLYPRNGEVYFDTKQSLTKVYKISIINSDCLRVGIRLRNRLHNQSISMEGVGYIYSSNNIRPVELSQVAPRAINVQISPAAPIASDTFFALYQYVDINGDKESGTIISWFKNGIQLFEIQNKSSWTNAELIETNKIVPNDKISCQITPSDGRDFGSTVFSPVVTIQAQPPGAENVRIVSFRNNILNNRFDTSSSFQVTYTFQTDDEGTAGVEDGTIIKWLVNGQLFKEGVFSEFEQDPYVDPKVLAPNEVINGTSAHIIGNQVQVEVTPKTLLVEGEPITTQVITVENSIPIISDVQVTPLQPSPQSTLQVNWTVDDLDITNFITQTDQSEIRWFQSANGIDFSEVNELRNSKTVAPFYLNAGNSWKAQITPYDGLELGVKAESNLVTISA